MPTMQRRRVTQGLRLRGSMRAMARLNQAPMPMAVRDAKNARATVMAVTVARVVSVRIVVIARTVRRLTASSHWKALPLIPEGQMRFQPP